MKSETPRTDAAQVPDHAMREMVVSAGMARELERELNQLKTDHACLEAIYKRLRFDMKRGRRVIIQ
jgi:hypothetical protein